MLTGINTTTATKLQLGAGLISKTKYVSGTTITDSWKQSNVLTTTTGGITLSIVPEYFTPQVDGLFENTKGGGKRIIRYIVTLSFTAPETSLDLIKKAIGSTSTSSGGVVTGNHVIASGDYSDLYVLAEKSSNTILQITLKNSINTNGLNLTTTNNANGTISFEIQANYDVADMDTAPFEIEEI